MVTYHNYWCVLYLGAPYAPENTAIYNFNFGLICGLKNEKRTVTWLTVFSICTRPRLGSSVLMTSTMDSRLSCCMIRSLWLPSRLKPTLKMTSGPCRNNISRRRLQSLNLNEDWWRVWFRLNEKCHDVGFILCTTSCEINDGGFILQLTLLSEIQELKKCFDVNKRLKAKTNWGHSDYAEVG